jgi:hypothetical protein
VCRCPAPNTSPAFLCSPSSDDCWHHGKQVTTQARTSCCRPDTVGKLCFRHVDVGQRIVGVDTDTQFILVQCTQHPANGVGSSREGSSISKSGSPWAVSAPPSIAAPSFSVIIWLPSYTPVMLLTHGPAVQETMTHVAEEEGTFLPSFVTAVTPDSLLQLGIQFDAAKARAPTRSAAGVTTLGSVSGCTVYRPNATSTWTFSNASVASVLTSGQLGSGCAGRCNEAPDGCRLHLGCTERSITSAT